jgi:hypothetical protein
MAAEIDGLQRRPLGVREVERVGVNPQREGGVGVADLLAVGVRF